MSYKRTQQINPSTHRCCKDIANGLLLIPVLDTLSELNVEHVVALQDVVHLVEYDADHIASEDRGFCFE